MDDIYESHYNAAVDAAALVAAAIAARPSDSSTTKIAELSIQVFAAVLDEALARLSDDDESDDESDDEDDDEEEDDEEEHDHGQEGHKH
jgi:hypothetical protein